MRTLEENEDNNSIDEEAQDNIVIGANADQEIVEILDEDEFSVSQRERMPWSMPT